MLLFKSCMDRTVRSRHRSNRRCSNISPISSDWLWEFTGIYEALGRLKARQGPDQSFREAHGVSYMDI